MVKQCTGCKTSKPISEFYKHPKGKDGLHSRCKDCLKWYAKNRRNTAIGRVYHNKYRNKHKAENRNYNKNYRKTFMGRLRGCFSGMKQRCNNKNNKRYKDYGGRGIKCNFKSFDEFANYVLNELNINPHGLQIDRIDNNGHYEPGNIRFVTSKINNNNRRNPKRIKF